MLKPSIPLACEQALAEAVAEVATELRLVNVIDLIDYVQTRRFANIEDLIHSSAELYFKQGALCYAWAAEVSVQWETPPSVSLNLEFRWRGATAFFKLMLDAARAAIDIQHLEMDMPGSSYDMARRFSEAIADARLTPPRRTLTTAGMPVRNANR
jgi:hypothetical protein